MRRYLTLAEVLEIHRRVIATCGGSPDVRDLGALESAAAQLRATFGGADLYSSVEAKAAAICFSLAMNHGFVDGNKRVAHAAMETFLVLNGYELVASVDDAERAMLGLACGEMGRDDLTEWVAAHSRALS